MWAKQLLNEMGLSLQPVVEETQACFAPINIALCKYWGKRDALRHLPATESLSVALPCYGAWTSLKLSNQDKIILQQQLIDPQGPFAKKVFEFLDLLRLPGQYLEIRTELNIPHSAGLASSAAGFAALTKSLAQLYGWNTSVANLAQIARWGSGSATRSFYNGWVHWPVGVDSLGRDSYGQLLPEIEQMPGLCIALPSHPRLKEKDFSSRSMMAHVASNSLLYESWLKCAQRDCSVLRQALKEKDISLVITTAERNARAMHATLADLEDFYHYETSESWRLKIKINNLRQKGWPLGWTQDAGPQVKLLCRIEDAALLKKYFSEYTFTEIQTKF